MTAMKTNKTNAARLLDQAKIAYELIPYAFDENDLSALHVAEALNEPIEQVFKTLVLKGDKNGYFVCVIPGESELDLKLAAKASGNKNCDLIPQKDLLPLTGYIRGGCSPIGMKKHFPTYIHESCLLYEFMFVSAGQRGLQLKITPKDLIEAATADCNLLVSHKKVSSHFVISENTCIFA
ncbi:Cys-tRNA(Pro)/Cys-tRNA(Cys) deacylase [Bacteroidia bacterium]|nr:Cys-tRNA(Pro)/Cys-tRNA(Cys) deacylase [Bacteroidia bacterium]GHV71369.1 Cys-tRNA(Pro)/Cys-tRNA(Cys) deacylase [Bacteroidia bacterium]